MAFLAYSPSMEPDDALGETVWLTISPEEAGERLDRILAHRYREVRSRTYFQHLIEEGNVLLNGVPEKKRSKPKAGDEVEVTFLLAPELDLKPEPIPLDILYEDEHILAINKPPGMVVHPAPGNWTGTFVNALLSHCASLELSGAPLRPGIVHRLDKDTSGLLLAAKTALAHQRLVALFASRQVHKEYLAICVGNLGDGEVHAPIGRHPRQRKVMAVRPEGGGRDALTRYRTLATKGDLSLVRIELITGRTHQARVHMRYRGAAVLGDATYGSASANSRFGVTRQMLHAERIHLTHPMTGALLQLQAPLPADMQVLVDQIMPGYRRA